jgi:hypothetical protein
MERDMGTVAAKPATAPSNNLRNEKPVVEGNIPDLHYMPNYTDILSASQGGKRLSLLRESPRK